MEQRYPAGLAVIADGRGVGEITAQFGVSRQLNRTIRLEALVRLFGWIGVHFFAELCTSSAPAWRG
jgi:hypothetical protein